MAGDETSHGAAMSASGSFWELGQYKRTVKRIDDGLSLCHSLMALIKERGDIETAYAKQLKHWSRRWHDNVDKSPEYGTLATSTKAVLDEADKMADLHNRIRDRLIEEVHNTIRVWQKDNFHQKALSGLKESKEMEDAFRKAQKPWAKLYLKVDKCKKDFHQACKSERTAIQQDKNAQCDTSVSADKTKQFADKVERCGDERVKAKTAYDTALADLNAYNGKYLEDMTMVFESCQEMERKRLKFFKEMLFGVHKCLDVSQEPKLNSIYRGYWETIECADADMDLRWWANNQGTGMAMNWPAFEEYSELLHAISRNPAKLKSASVAANTIQLKGVNLDRFRQEFAGEYSPEMRPIAKRERQNGGAAGVKLVASRPTVDADPRPSAAGDTAHHARGHPDGMSNGKRSPAGAEGVEGVRDSLAHYDNGFDDYPDGDGEAVQVDSGQVGVPVRALYDYAAQEKDELDISKGDAFEKLEEEDEQGWCKGRKDGRVGLYPANYATEVN